MFKTAFKNIRRAPFQGIAAVAVMSLTFFVGSLIAILLYSSAQVLSFFETRPQVIVFLKNSATTEQVSALQTKLEKDERVKDLKFVSKEDALAIYKSATSDNPLLGQLVSPSIFPASIEFSVKDLKLAPDLITETKTEAIVDSVGFTASLGNGTDLDVVLARLTKIVYYIRLGGALVAGVLITTSFLILTVIVSMRITSRKGEIETMRLIGATGGFIRGPIMMEALIYVATGVVIGWVLSLILVLYATPAVVSYFGVVPVLPRQSLAFFELNLVILGFELLIAVFIAILGSLVAVGRALK